MNTRRKPKKFRDVDIFIIKKTLQDQRDFFETGKTREINFRISRLKKLKKAIQAHHDDIIAALQSDMGKPPFEAYTSEIAFLYREIDDAIKNTAKWSKTRKPSTPLLFRPAKSYVRPEPRGVTLIIGPWNYPFMLTMAPLVPAIAAGNTAVMKPASLAPATSAVIRKIISETFDRNYVAVFEGGVDLSTFLLEQKFDHIFFTGGPRVGRIVMEAAAHHLTPVTLELGGKSPVIIDETADLKTAVRKIAWGKFFNAGQTCLAPDYVLLPEQMREPFLDEIKKTVQEFYGDRPEESPDFARIINQDHFIRLKNLLSSGTTMTGGSYNQDKLYIAPTILDGVTFEDPVMKEEIFGPILPVLTYSDREEAVQKVKRLPKPLALYIFSSKKWAQKWFLDRIESGGVSINETILHISNPHLPFGGVGESGMGSYHGIHGFTAFSHMRSIYRRTFSRDWLLRYPPYRLNMKWLRKLFG